MPLCVDKSGFYNPLRGSTTFGCYTEAGKIAEVVVHPAAQTTTYLPAVGFIEGQSMPFIWELSGKACHGDGQEFNLVSYAGTERPKKKRRVKLAPVLFKYQGKYIVTGDLFSSEDKAKGCCIDSTFVRWLINTPYEISVEVDE